MLPKNSPILMALLTAYCAMAAPVNTQPSQMRAVINTLKAQLKADNITDASAAVDAVKHSLRAIAARSETEIDDAMIDGLMDFLSDPHSMDSYIAYLGSAKYQDDLNEYLESAEYQEVKAEYLKSKGLNAEGAVQKRDQEETANDTLVLDTATIKQVVDHGVKYFKRGECPDGSQADFCCVVM